MKKFLLILLALLFLFSPLARAANTFNGSDQNEYLADVAALNLPDNDWTISLWVKMSTNSITVNVRMYEWNNVPTTPQFILTAIKSNGSVSGECEFNITDTDGDNAAASSITGPFTSNLSWTNVILQRTGGGPTAAVFTMYVNNTSVATATNNALDGLDVARTWIFADKPGGTRAYPGAIAEAAKWDRALTADERAGLVKGFAPNCYLNSLTWYVPMLRNYVELKNNITVTNVNSTVTDHPRIIYCN